MSSPRFETSDLRHAVFLLAKGFPLTDTSCSKGRVAFVFACSPEDARPYLGGDDRVSARALFAAWQTLRTLCDQAKSER
jgi:hypothetical protein